MVRETTFLLLLSVRLSWSSSAIFPTSVAILVEMTMPVALPFVTVVDEYAILALSPIGMSRFENRAAGDLVTGTTNFDSAV